MSRKPGARLFSVAAIMAVAIKGALPPNTATTVSMEVAYPVFRMRVCNISTWAASCFAALAEVDGIEPRLPGDGHQPGRREDVQHREVVDAHLSRRAHPVRRTFSCVPSILRRIGCRPG